MPSIVESVLKENRFPQAEAIEYLHRVQEEIIRVLVRLALHDVSARPIYMVRVVEFHFL